MSGFEFEILLPLPRVLRLEVSIITLIFAYFLKVYRYFVCTPCACSGCQGQKNAADLLVLELQTLASCHTGKEN